VARIDRSDPDVLAASERFGQLLRDMLTERDLKNNVLHRRSGVNAGYIGILASGHSPDGKANVPSNNILIQLGEGFAYNPLTKVVDPIAAAAYTNLFMDALRVKPTVIVPSGPETRVSKAFPRLIRAFDRAADHGLTEHRLAHLLKTIEDAIDGAIGGATAEPEEPDGE